MKYTVDNYGFLLGMASVPPGIPETDFYNNDIANNLVKAYKDAREKNSFGDKANDTNVLYNPIGFKTFDENNLMFYTLFDDFAYPNRVFHPFHGNGGHNALYRNFDYRLVVGLNTFYSDMTEKPLLEKVFSDNQLQNYVFTCATRLKINPIFLCGTGLLCVELIKSTLRKMHLNSSDKLLLLNGVGSDELIVINFSNNLCDIAKYIFKIRNLQFQNLKIDTAELYNTVLSQSLANNNKGNTTIKESHVFSSSYSVSGYAFNRENLPKKIESKGSSLRFTWIIKPGHIGNFTLRLNDCLKKLGLEQQTDRLFINNPIVSFLIDGDKFNDTDSLLYTLDELRYIDPNKLDVREQHVSISVTDDDNYLIPKKDGTFEHITSFNTEKHLCTREIFSPYLFNMTEMAELRSTLDCAHISKVIKERIMKMYQNYNDCIQDPQFVISFISLRPFLKFLMKIVQSYASGKSGMTSESVHEWLDGSVRDFEQAYLNRFHQSNRMRTLSDFNLEWNGGIQQLICSMDFAYKTLMHCCGINIPHAFMYVSGHDRVHVNDHSYRINMQHITYPELFASTMWKEFFNFLPLSASLRDDRNKLPVRKIISDDFIAALKYRIGEHLRFNRANRTHKIFLQSLDKEFMTSITADVLSFLYGYNSNYNDFIYWYMRFLLQTPIAYNQNGSINRERFTRFFCRVMLVHTLAGVKSPTIEQLRFQPLDPSLGELWTCTFEDVKTLSQLMSDILTSYGFMDTINSMISTMLKHTFPESSEYLKQKLQIAHPEDAEKDIFKNVREQLEKELTTTFCNDEVPLELQGHEIITGLIPAYLKHLRTLSSYNSKSQLCMALTRSSKGQTAIDQKTAGFYESILADPLGGSFCIRKNVQKEYFKARSVLYLSLFHFYHKNITKLTLIESDDNT